MARPYLVGWLRRLFGRDKLDHDLDRELRFHIDEEIRRLTDAGVPHEESRRRALASFGGFEAMKETTRDARGTRWLEDLAQDLRYSLRMVRRSKGFAAAAILSLALGVGANAAVFSVVDALLMRPLDVAAPAQLAFLNRTGSNQQNLRFSYPMFNLLRTALTDVQFAAMTPVTRMQAREPEGAVLFSGQLVSGNWFDLLGVHPLIGRTLTAEDDRGLGAHPVVVLSEGFWARQFGRDPHIVGRTLDVNGTPLTVVGVAARGFSGLTVGQLIDAWVPVTMQDVIGYQGNASANNADEAKPWIPQEGIEWLTIVTRVAPPVAAAAAAGRIDAAYRQDLERRVAEISDPDRRRFRLRDHVEMLPGDRGLSPLRQQFSSALAVLMSTVALVLLIACANLANLLMARNSARGQEFAVRLSLGARRGRLVRQMMTESFTLALAGGVAGIVVAEWGGQALLRLASSTSQPIPLDVAVNLRLVLFAMGTALLTGVLFGVLPALRLSKVHAYEAIKTGGRVIGGSHRVGTLPFGKVLVVTQVAMSLALLVGSVLFLRTFSNLMTVDVGYDGEHVLATTFNSRLAGIDGPRLPGLYDRLLTEARRVPGSSLVSFAAIGVATTSAWTSGIAVEGHAPLSGADEIAREDVVGPDYFRTVGMRLLRGRDFTTHDLAKGPKVAVVNEAMAKHFFPGENPIGRHLGYGDPIDVEIVGIVADVKVDGPRSTPPPMVFYPVSQRDDEAIRVLYVRVTGPVDQAKRDVRRAIQVAEPNLAVREVVTVNELTERLVTSERLVSRLTAVFSLLAVAVSCLGLYGTVSYSVSRRRNELGIRLALGASTAGIGWLVLRETLVLVAVGCVAGLAVLLPSLHLLQSMLYGLSPRDPGTLVICAMGLTLLGLLAGALPAWRASRVDPLTALRAE